jgi:transmembrane sensor
VVDRRDEGVRVLVRRGRVRVEVEGAKMAVSAGEERWFPVARPAPPPPVATEGSRVRASARQRPTPRWRLLAQGGDFQRAYKLLGQPGSKPSDAIEELMLAADVARRSNHFAEALPYYDRVILTHSGDPRAALAALTKARITLHRLGRPREAAAAFAQARGLSLPEAFIEEAMLGEVMAWRRAGEPARAQAIAAEYLRRYPGPSSAENVRRLGDTK